MFPAAIHVIECLKPKAFIFENVKGLLRQTFSDYFEYILLRLTYPSFNVEVTLDWQQHLDTLRSANNSSDSGTKYNVQFKLINAANYGVPQNRDSPFGEATPTSHNCWHQIRSRLRVVIPSRDTFSRKIIVGYARYWRILGAS
jgi:C-5 cytosine-specific DNA methylase